MEDRRIETHRRKADGRRVFTPQFKQEQVARVGSEELTVAELARERAAAQRVRELERALGKKVMAIEILQAARDDVKKDRASTAGPGGDGAEEGPELSGAWDQSRVCVSDDCRSARALCDGRGPRGHRADPHDLPHPVVVWCAARPRARQSGVCDRVQREAHPARRVERAVVQRRAGDRVLERRAGASRVCARLSRSRSDRACAVPRDLVGADIQ